MSKKPKGLPDDELLALLRGEEARAIGYNNDAELTEDRTRALEYQQGVMSDLTSQANRSAATTSDIADAVETVMPDLIEMFSGGEDVASFAPRGPEDEDGAAQETDFLYHTLFNVNDGFTALYTGFKDALLLKTGIWTWWWDDEVMETDSFTGSPVEYQMACEACEAHGVRVFDVETEAGEPGEDGEPPEPVITWKVEQLTEHGAAKYKAVAPEDFAVARDTIALRDTTYCVMRARPRAQELLLDGYDADKVDALPAATITGRDGVDLARDTAGESEQASSASTDHGLRTVEVLHHCIRLVENRKAVLHAIVTDKACTVILDHEIVDRVPFAACTPYMVAHRFLGESVADKLFEIQRIKTALLRLQLDSGYFALNQRNEVATNDCTKDTMSDLLRNEPAVPVRSKTGNAIKPITAGPLNFDVQGAIEYASVMGEQRTGIVRNAQGLNPDTLHDTAKGQMALMTMAQKRVRLIARVIAETGLKDLFLGLHGLTRKHSTKMQKVRLRGEWVDVDPSEWGNRNDMTIEIGVGAGGREQELQALQFVAGALETVASLPQGKGIVSPANLYKLAKKLVERSGLKDAEAYVTDPATVADTPPPPDPKMVEIQMKAKLAEDKAAAEMQLAREKMNNEMILAREKMALDAESDRRDQYQRHISAGLGVRMGGAVG